MNGRSSLNRLGTVHVIYMETEWEREKSNAYNHKLHFTDRKSFPKSLYLMLFKQIKIVYRLRNILDNFSLFRRFFYWHAENSSIEKISLQKIRWRNNNNSNKSTSIDFEKMWKVSNEHWTMAATEKKSMRYQNPIKRYIIIHSVPYK